MADFRDKGYGWGGNGIGWRDGDGEEPATGGVAGSLRRRDEDRTEGEKVGWGEGGERGDGGWRGGTVGGELGEDAFGRRAR